MNPRTKLVKGKAKESEKYRNAMIQVQAWAPKKSRVPKYQGVNIEASSPPPFPARAAFLLHKTALV